MQEIQAGPDLVVPQHREFYRKVAEILEMVREKPLVDGEVEVLEGIMADLEAGKTSPSG